MRCEACNTLLTPYEDSIVGVVSGERLGLCGGCLREVYPPIQYVGDPLAQQDVEIDDDPPLNTWR